MLQAGVNIAAIRKRKKVPRTAIIISKHNNSRGILVLMPPEASPPLLSWIRQSNRGRRRSHNQNIQPDLRHSQNASRPKYHTHTTYVHSSLVKEVQTNKKCLSKKFLHIISEHLFNSKSWAHAYINSRYNYKVAFEADHCYWKPYEHNFEQKRRNLLCRTRYKS